VTGARRSRLFAFYPRAQRGFTLLELMVVLVIVSIILTFVTLTAGGDPRAEQLQRETRRLAALLEMASEEAVLSSQQLAVRFSEEGYEFLVSATTLYCVSVPCPRVSNCASSWRTIRRLR